MVKVAETKIYKGKKTQVPSAVMQALELSIGDILEWHVENGNIILKRKLTQKLESTADHKVKNSHS